MEPEHVYRIRLQVTDADIDMQGHVNNIAYVRWVQEVALAHSMAVGFGFEAYQRLGCMFVIRRHEIDFLRPALRGHALEIRTWLGSVMAAKCHRLTEVRDEEDGTVYAKADTVWGFLDAKTGRPTRIPDEIRKAFSQPQRARRVKLVDTDAPEAV